MQRVSIRVAMTLVITLLFSAICFAGTYTESVSVDIPVRHETKGSPGSEAHVFLLAAEDPSNPMPDGSEDGYLEVTTEGDEDIDFGSILFEEPGTYYYDVSEKGTDDSYRVMIAALNDGTSDMVIWDRRDGSKTDRIVFKEKRAKSPKTGDMDIRFRLFFASIAVVTALAALLTAIQIRRKEQ